MLPSPLITSNDRVTQRRAQGLQEFSLTAGLWDQVTTNCIGIQDSCCCQLNGSEVVGHFILASKAEV